MTENHKAVLHPFSSLKKTSDKFMTWVADYVLASPIMFYTAFVLPLLSLPMSDSIKLILAVVSGSWIQWWALPALQRRQNELGVKQDLKADSDHKALVYLATGQDDIKSMLESMERNLSMLVHPASEREIHD